MKLVKIWVPSRHSSSKVSRQHRLRTGRSEKTANTCQLNSRVSKYTLSLPPKLFYRALRLSPTCIGRILPKMVLPNEEFALLLTNWASKPEIQPYNSRKNKKYRVFSFILINICQHFLFTICNTLQYHGTPLWRFCVITPHCMHRTVTFAHACTQRRDTKPYPRWLCRHTRESPLKAVGAFGGGTGLPVTAGPRLGPPPEQPTAHLCRRRSLHLLNRGGKLFFSQVTKQNPITGLEKQ